VAAVLFAGSLLSLLALILKQFQMRDRIVDSIFNNIFVRYFVAVAILPLTAFCKLLGIGNDGQGMRDDQSALDDEWVSKLHYMTQQTKAIVDASENRILAEMKTDIKSAENHVISHLNY
jgi:hypothetical protein